MHTPITASAVRYIKLGAQGKWVTSAFENHRLEFGYADIPQALVEARDWESVRQQYLALGKPLRLASRYRNELEALVTAPEDTLWVTFERGHMWWAFARSEIPWLGGDESRHGARARPLLEPWRCTDVNGEPLRLDALNPRLLVVPPFATTYTVKEAAYALRRINGQSEALVEQAIASQEHAVALAEAMIKRLHWRHFEVMTDLIFSANGYKRTSALGGDMADFDLALTHSATGENVFVQVKSQADEATLTACLEIARQTPACDRYFFVCHSLEAEVMEFPGPPFHLWTGRQLARQAVEAGLFDWLATRMR